MRQDLIADAAGAQAFAVRLKPILDAALNTMHSRA
jgi:predicted N-formylglutamate amidohydrolase